MGWVTVLAAIKKYLPFVKNAVVEEAKDRAGVAKFKNPNGDSLPSKEKQAIIFVHGFKGGMLETWGETLEFLRRDPAFDKWDFYAMGYNTNILPNLLKGLWIAAPEIKIIGKSLKGEIDALLAEGYKTISICAHSMGGLVTQSAILQLDMNDIAKLHSVIMFGTPSGGLSTARFGKFINDQVRDMAEGSEFITNLRNTWNQRFSRGLSFGFLAVAGDADEFVPRKSSIDPFDEEFRKVIGGNHLVIVKPSRETDQTVSTIKQKVLYNNNYEFDWEPAALAIEYSNFNEALNAFNKTGFENLDTRNKVNYILATESVGKSEEALELALKTADESTDVLGVIGGRFKRHYINTGAKDSLEKALEYYKKGLEMSTANNNDEQIFYHAINCAFLDLFKEEFSKAKELAQTALDAANRSSRDDVWKQATIAEAKLHLGNKDEAIEAYKLAGSKAREIRQKDSILINATQTVNILGWTEDEQRKLVEALG